MFQVSEVALDSALEHIEARGDTDILPTPFEYGAIRHEWATIRSYLASQDLDMWNTRPLRRCLVPKQRLGLRIATQLDPLDTLIITALMYEVGSTIEAARIPTDQMNVHSHRFLPGSHGQFFDPTWSFNSFRRHSLELAGRDKCRFVLVTDIADFYPRIYAHPLENTLVATVDQDHARLITKLLKSWNMGVSYGLPVGSSAFRLLADLAINDIDQSLRAEKYEFCRFSDDYRIFAPNERTAREALAFLATALFKNHGLTIQESKTRILTSDEFAGAFALTERDEERNHMADWFEYLVGSLGIDTYEPIEYDQLDDQQRAVVDQLNLWDIVSDAVNEREGVSFKLLAFALRRIAQLGLRDRDHLLLYNLRQLYAVFREAVEAAVSQSGLSPSEKLEIGERLLGLMDDDVVGHLEYHRSWLIEPLTLSAEWGQAGDLSRVHSRFSDSFTRSATVLALGRAGQDYWFRSHKQDIDQFTSWEKRAFLRSASCLQKDEVDFWYRSVQTQLDCLERAVVAFARAFPLR